MIKSLWRKHPYVLGILLIAPSFGWEAYTAQDGIVAALNLLAIAICLVGLFWRDQALSLLLTVFALSFSIGLYSAHSWFSIALNTLGLLCCVASLLIPQTRRRALDAATIKALPPVDEDVRELLASGEKIAAIKLYRAHHKVGLKEALAAVDNFLAR